MSTSLAQSWPKVLEAIKSQVGEQVYTAWFQPTRIIEQSENTIKIGVPNKFCQDWLRDNYTDLITRILSQLFGRNFKILFIVQPEIASSPNYYTTQARGTPSATGAIRAQILNLNEKYTFENFVIGPGNRFAQAACMAISESPGRSYNPLFIYGGVGLGKTHLMQAIGAYLTRTRPELKLLYISSERFVNELITSIQNRTTLRFRQRYRSVDVLLIDDIHFIAGKESTQEEFFHTFNTLYDAGKQIVVSSDRSPKNIPGLEERLVSRFGWGLVTDVQPPDLETRVAILRKKAEKEVIAVPDDVSFFIAEQITSNIRELEGALIRVVAYASLTGKRVSLDLVKEVLKDSLPLPKRSLSIEEVQRRVADYFDVRLADMKSKKRTQTVAYPRQIAMFLVRKLTDFSLLEIGESFGGKDHSTILHACQKIKKQTTEDPKLKNLLGVLSADLDNRDK